MFVSASLSVSLLASVPIKNINFQGNIKIPTKTLQKNLAHHIGNILDQNEIDAIIKETEDFYHRNNYVLAFARIETPKENDATLNIIIEKYADFNAQAIGEMKQRKIETGMINQIFFEGNEKISTYRLMKLITPNLGTVNTQANLNEIVQNIQNYYRQHRYELAYAQIKSVDDKGIITIEIKKYPNFKALYACEGKH